jgi:hypothetical protein
MSVFDATTSTQNAPVSSRKVAQESESCRPFTAGPSEGGTGHEGGRSYSGFAQVIMNKKIHPKWTPHLAQPPRIEKGSCTVLEDDLTLDYPKRFRARPLCTQFKAANQIQGPNTALQLHVLGHLAAQHQHLHKRLWPDLQERAPTIAPQSALHSAAPRGVSHGRLASFSFANCSRRHVHIASTAAGQLHFSLPPHDPSILLHIHALQNPKPKAQKLLKPSPPFPTTHTALPPALMT